MLIQHESLLYLLEQYFLVSLQKSVGFLARKARAPDTQSGYSMGTAARLGVDISYLVDEAQLRAFHALLNRSDWISCKGVSYVRGDTVLLRQQSTMIIGTKHISITNMRDVTVNRGIVTNRIFSVNFRPIRKLRVGITHALAEPSGLL